MQIFKSEVWGDRINFVDDNNAFVGYDYSRNCCEDFSYSFSFDPERSTAIENEAEFDLAGYQFDPTHHNESRVGGDCDYDNSITFKLQKDGAPNIYLTLRNHHNGYYSHGFEFKHDEKLIIEGDL